MNCESELASPGWRRGRAQVRG